MSTPGSPEWYIEQLEYYNAYIGKLLGGSVALGAAFAKAIGFNIESTLDPLIKPYYQSVYTALHFTQSYNEYGTKFHERSRVVYPIIGVYFLITSVLYFVNIRSEYIKNSCIYNTSLSILGNLITYASLSQIVAAEGFNCRASYFFLNIGIYLWFLGSVNRSIALVIRSKLATLHNNHVVNVEKNIWVKLARKRLGSDYFLFKMTIYSVFLSLIPGIVVSASKQQNNFVYNLGLCVNPSSWYTFIVMILLLGIISFFILACCARNIINDIYLVRYQTFGYIIMYPAFGIPITVALLGGGYISIKFMTGYFSILYLVLILGVLHQTLAVTFPIGLLYYRRLRKHRLQKILKRRDFASFARIILNENLWNMFCDFSLRCFTEENTHFIQRYIELLNVMRKNGRVFCSSPTDESYVFHDMKSNLLEKVKRPSEFSSKYQILFTYDLPLDSLLIFDVEPSEHEKEIIDEIYGDFFAENAPFELNIPSDLLISVKKRYTSDKLSCLMYEEIKNAVVTMLYENTYVKFVEETSNILSLSDSNLPTSYDSNGLSRTKDFTTEPEILASAVSGNRDTPSATHTFTFHTSNHGHTLGSNINSRQLENFSSTQSYESRNQS